jgi:hypothetical protein
MAIEGVEEYPILPALDPYQSLAISLIFPRTFPGLHILDFRKHMVRGHHLLLQNFLSDSNARGHFVIPCFWEGYYRVELCQSSQGLARKEW